MPSSLPDPVLALSLTNVQKLNNVDVEQLANLWNVFTKCKESLESGRRLENLSWRLWFREAHLLPPDVSLSDITDYTPLDTPLMSRRGSVTGSFSTSTSRALSQATTQSTLPLFSNAISQRVMSALEPLSDPEDEDWSDDDVDDISIDKINDVKQDSRKDRGRAATPRQDTASQEGNLSSAGSNSRRRDEAGTSQATSSALISSSSSSSKDQKLTTREVTQPSGNLTPSAGERDRKRAVSSSSAFGSRARVKQHNTIRRRRPLSFQQAIESLLSEESQGFPANASSESFNKTPKIQSTSLSDNTRCDVGVDTSRNIEGQDWQSQEIQANRVMQQSSAPADFSQPNTPSVTVASPNAVEFDLKEKQEETKLNNAVDSINANGKKAEENAETSRDKEVSNTKEDEKKSKFFVAGQSVGDGDEDEDEWSSASSTDSGQGGKRTAIQKKIAEREMENLKRQQREMKKEREKAQVLFQKVPVKSASTVDVRVAERRRSSVPMQGTDEQETNAQPVRGLLSSLFHPEEAPHPPPGQLAGRPHASAADLRKRPQRLSNSRTNSKTKEEEESPTQLARIPSTTQVPSLGTGALKLSKSAVALPVLSTMGSRSAAKGKGAVNTASKEIVSRDSAVFDDDDDEDEEGGLGESGDTDASDEHVESEALARLNRLAFKKKERQRQGKRLSSQIIAPSASAQNRKRQSNPHSLLNVEVSPEVKDEEIMTERREVGKNKRSSLPMALSASHRFPASHLPETSMPQTPRTTRRNMIREELSESLRQNLLWERQSRHRMLGIGAPTTNTATATTSTTTTSSTAANTNSNTTASDFRSRLSQMQPPLASTTSNTTGRNHSVLGGGALRPLTTSHSILDGSHEQSQRDHAHANAPHRTYTGDFHHAGW